MLEVFRKWFVRQEKPQQDWSALKQWVEDRQYEWREVRGHDGFVIEGRQGTQPWRLEWGPSQRDYLKSPEMRLRAEVAVAPELQALVLNRRLQERMESEVFNHYVEDLQTRADARTPPEMRWLVMYTPLTGPELRQLRDRWAAVSNVKQWLELWLSGPLGQALHALDADPGEPLVMMIARGRLTLRLALPEPRVTHVEHWLHLFECAVREARRVGLTGCERAEDEVTAPGMFIPSAMAGEPADAH
ncbi:MAG: hypothetical protein JNJ71_07910 [Rubrivivax sp.]|nr:hypothetical protein [Rubrivivax sp.]